MKMAGWWSFQVGMFFFADGEENGVIMIAGHGVSAARTRPRRRVINHGDHDMRGIGDAEGGVASSISKRHLYRLKSRRLIWW